MRSVFGLFESSVVTCAHRARIFVGWDSVPTGSGRRPNLLWLRPGAAFSLSFFLSAICVASGDDWQSDFYRSGGGWWPHRIVVNVRNDGDSDLAGWPVALALGNQPGQLPLAGHPADSLRVGDRNGNELLWGLADGAGNQVRTGPIPDNGSLVLPVECQRGQSASYFIYFGNPSAGAVPDFFEARTDLVNGDMEFGSGDAPAGWVHDPGDDEDEVSWSTENPQSGRRCLKTVVAPDAQPSWIATRQRNIAVLGGARYRFTAWVRAENVRGYAGWYLHLGNSENPMLQSPMLPAGDGTFDWRQVSLEFAVPVEANRLSLGTVLRGTGTAWFDNARLERLSDGALRVTVGAVESISVEQHKPAPTWLADDDGSPIGSHRAVVRMVHTDPTSMRRAWLPVDLRPVRARNRGRLDVRSLRVVGSEGVLPHRILGDQLLLETRLAPRSVQDYHVYFSETVPAGPTGADDAAAPAAIPGNLVRNGDFEGPDDPLAGWTPTGGNRGSNGPWFGTDDPGRAGLGERCLKMHVPPSAGRAWRGWHQSVPVEPGQTYLLAVWVKCQDVEGDVRVHAHRRQADGQLSSESPYASIGPSIGGTTDWTLLTGQLTMPRDTTVLQLHLTMEHPGTLWHDHVTLIPVLAGDVLHVERWYVRDDPLAVWQVPAVVKVFAEDVPEPSSVRFHIGAARNESEPLQLAVRSTGDRTGVRIALQPPTGPDGFRLDDAEVHVVGYVPIDYPTNYYQSESPVWHRKVPGRTAASDGWPGLWPDPLLPTDRFDLQAGVTQPIWITFPIPKEAPAGDYTGRVLLLDGQQTIAQYPLEVRVWDFCLPDERNLAAIYDVRLGPGGSALWDKSLDDLYPEIIRMMASRRLCPDTIRPAPRFWIEDDQVRADFTEYDRAARVYFDELRFPVAYTPWDFYLFGWGHPPKSILGQAPYEGRPPFESADRSRLRPEYRQVYQQMLRLFWDHLRRRGWDRKVVLYISDEPFDRQEPIREQMKALCQMIHEVDPEIPIYSSTWHHVPDWDGALDVWGIGHDGRVPVAKMQQLLADGKRIWFTTDGQMCTDTPYCAIERLLPHYCFQYGAEAYEFWGVSWLTYNPLEFGWHAYIHQSSEPGRSYWIRYPNGDGFLLYPGAAGGYEGILSSLRFEQAREGVEDYEYLRLLQQLTDAAQRAGRDTRSAREALAAAAALVAIPNAGGRYSTEILPDPSRLYQVRQSLAEAIENLSRAGVQVEK
jgi:hypothetical protein